MAISHFYRIYGAYFCTLQILSLKKVPEIQDYGALHKKQAPGSSSRSYLCVFSFLKFPFRSSIQTGRSIPLYHISAPIVLFGIRPSFPESDHCSIRRWNPAKSNAMSAVIENVSIDTRSLFNPRIRWATRSCTT